MSQADTPNAVSKIEEHRDILEDVADMDVPLSDIADTLLEVEVEE